MSRWLILIVPALIVGQSISPMYAEGIAKPLPEWITKSIDSLRKSRSRTVIEEATYEKRRVFEFTSGDRFDTGDEHTLLAEDGKKICQFGGFVGRVTSGSCDIEKIIYVRTIYSRTP